MKAPIGDDESEKTKAIVSHRSSFGTQLRLGCRWIKGLVPNHSLYGYAYIMSVGSFFFNFFSLFRPLLAIGKVNRKTKRILGGQSCV